MNVDGMVTAVDIRVPGYPAFLAVIYWLSGKIGPDARRWVMSVQVVVDLLTWAVAGCLAATLLALWLTVLCPFTANYVAVPLTETLATLFTTLTILFLCLLLLRVRGPIFEAEDRAINLYLKEQWFAALAGISAGFGTLIRPETPLVLMTSCVVLAWYFLQGGKWSSERPN